MGSNKKAHAAKAVNTDISSWSDLVADFNKKAQKLLKLDSDQTKKMKIELQSLREKNTYLDDTLGEMTRDRDDALAKLQRTMEDYARHCKEREAVNRAWESTLDTSLETAKNEIAHAFVNGFKGAVEQVEVVQPDLDTSLLDPFKSVVDGKIVKDEG